MNIPILTKEATFTPYIFYSFFLKTIAQAYREFPNDKIQFVLTDNGDESFFELTYRIDPIAIPLLLSISSQLKNFHKDKIDLILYNTRGTSDVLEFLFLSDFFYLSGSNTNPQFPIGQNLYNFNEAILGGFKGSRIKPQHKVRAYSINDKLIEEITKTYDNDEKLRDALVEFYVYEVKEHFSQLLYENELTSNQHNLFINILSELITNGVVHSKSATYALMFVDRYKSKFSISDNGIGFSESLKNKDISPYYKPESLTNRLIENSHFNNINDKIVLNLISIFEALFFSFMKNRRGLFDLMINVVLNTKGYFRLHSENSQIIISNRMKNELIPLYQLRENIYKCHNEYELKVIDETTYKNKIDLLFEQSLDVFLKFYQSVQIKFNSDIKFSSIRFFPVKFRGVHIEVEIPNKF